MERSQLEVGRPSRLPTMLAWVYGCLLVIGAVVYAQEADAAYLVSEGRLGGLILLGEHIEEVEARFAGMSPAPFAYPGFTVYLVPSAPPVMIAACQETGEVFHAELQQRDDMSMRFTTAQGTGMASSEADVLSAHGVPDETREFSDEILHLYPAQGLVFSIDRASRGVRSFGTFQGAYMRCP